MAFENPYRTRLSEFSSFVFDAIDNQDSLRFRGQWKEHFAPRMGASPSKVILEIGCSNAEFLSEIARSNRNNAFIGIDWKFKVVYKGARRIEREGLKNISLIRGPAQELLGQFAEGELDEIWVFFPDPWAKKSQFKHRLIQEPFLLECARMLRAGGALHIKTDHPGYFQWICSVLGCPVPALPEYVDVNPAERSRRARQVYARKIEAAPDELPAASERVGEAFQFGFSSIDYWNDPARPLVAFSQRQTVFERLFTEEKLPIYYFELIKR